MKNRYVFLVCQEAPLFSVFVQSALKYQKHKKSKKEDKQAVKEASKKAKKAKVSVGMSSPNNNG